MIPGDGIGPEISKAVKVIFQAAGVRTYFILLLTMLTYLYLTL